MANGCENSTVIMGDDIIDEMNDIDLRDLLNDADLNAALELFCNNEISPMVSEPQASMPAPVEGNSPSFTKGQLRSKIITKYKTAGQEVPVVDLTRHTEYEEELTEFDTKKLLLRRERNRESAKKSRQRKKQEEVELKEKNETLKQEKQTLTDEVTGLKASIIEIEKYLKHHSCVANATQQASTHQQETGDDVNYDCFETQGCSAVNYGPAETSGKLTLDTGPNMTSAGAGGSEAHYSYEISTEPVDGNSTKLATSVSRYDAHRSKAIVGYGNQNILSSYDQQRNAIDSIFSGLTLTAQNVFGQQNIVSVDSSAQQSFSNNNTIVNDSPWSVGPEANNLDETEELMEFLKIGTNPSDPKKRRLEPPAQ